MKRILFSVLMLLLSGICWAQGETEPNNTIVTANTIPYGTQIEASLSSSDQDYFKAEFNYDGTLYVQVEATNTGSYGAPLILSVYNGLTMTGGVFNPQLISSQPVGNAPIFPGETVNAFVKVCGVAKDNYYLRFESAGDFDYQFAWYPVNVAYNTPNISTPATAAPFVYGVPKPDAIGHEFWGNTTWDTEDYFTTTLPAADYDSVLLKIDANSNTCEGNPTRWLQYFLYKNGSATPFASGYVGNNTAVPNEMTVRSSIPLNGLQQGDNLMVRLVSNGAFTYSLLYKQVEYFEPDDEDNCCTYNAIDLPEGETATGNIGEYDYMADELIDQYDMYKITIPYAGAVRLFLEARNDECVPGEYYSLGCDVLDMYGNEIAWSELIYSDWDPPCNEVVADTLKLRAWSPGTYYLRLHTNYSSNYSYTQETGHWKLSYRIKYEVTDSATYIDTEPNNTIATAIPLAVGDTARGIVNFLQNAAASDFRDYYKVDMPADGKLRITVKAVSRSNDELYGSDYWLKVFAGNATSSAGNIVISGNPIMPDSVYTVTADVCAISEGDVYLQVATQFSNNYAAPYEYELSYQIIDTSSAWGGDTEPNDTRAQATLINTGQAITGKIRYDINDYNDYYKLLYSETDSLVVDLSVVNPSCVVSNRLLQLIGYRNSSQTSLFSRNLTLAAGDTGQITPVRMRIVVPPGNTDTIYLRITNQSVSPTGPFKYHFTTKPTRPVIEGDTTPCLNTYQYKAVSIAGVTYHWSLPDGGGTINATDSIATVTWNETGVRRVQLYLSNPLGVSDPSDLEVVVSGIPPTQVPVIYNFARTLSVSEIPQGVYCQWVRNGADIPGAVSPSYYAELDGNYTVKFVNDCGAGPASNVVSFAAAAQVQIITFNPTPDITLSPGIGVKLNASSSSGLPVFFQKVSGAGYIQNDTLYISGNGVLVGQVIVKSYQPGDDVFLPATEAYDTIQVLRGYQQIIFDTIPNQIVGNPYITLNYLSSAGLAQSYTITSGNQAAHLSVNEWGRSWLYIDGAGQVTIRAIQNGNANYYAADTIIRTFCVGVRTLTPIAGDPNPCINTYRYTTQKIPGAQFEWVLSGGGILTTHNDTAWVQWQTPGSYTLTVKANSPCDTVYTNTQTLSITTSDNAPAIVTGMLPADNAVDQMLPLKLSWIPGSNTTHYDLYVWDSTQAQPATPYVANIDGATLSYTLALNSFAYNTTYKWRIVSKNPCQSTSGPVQHFRLIPLPDLVVTDIQAPLTATSGQTITISWTVANIGSGSTLEGQNWEDGVYFSLDTFPNFHGSPNWQPSSWNSLTANGRPLLLGKKPRPSGLGVGQSYTNSLNFTLPLNYSFPVYIYVIAANNHPNYPLFQASVANDTLRKVEPLTITMAPVPDLRVDSVYTPVSTFSGSTVNVTYRVKNYGVLTPAGVSWRDSLFISQSPLFNREEAIPLTLPKTNSTYYPNVANAAVSNTTQLQNDSMVTKSVDVVIPNFIFGTWFVYVKTNAAHNTQLYEGAWAENNIGQAQLEVYLTATPKLTVQDLLVPFTTASTTQQIGVNWNIKNEGFFDNFEKNQGHFLSSILYRCPCTGYIPPNSVCVGPPVYRDSTSWGSSYWIDRVYLSTNPNAGPNELATAGDAILLNEFKHGIKQFAGIDYRTEYWNECSGTIANGPGWHNAATAIKPNTNFPGTLNFKMPSNLPEGNYYVYVYANPTKTVFEYPGTPQIKRSSLPITVNRPDLTVTGVSAPASATGGQPVIVNYNVLNTGTGAVFNHIRRDRLYVSNFSSFESSAQLVDTKTYTEDIPVGVAVPHSFTYTFPGPASGNKYFFVITNYDTAFSETNHNNNIGGPGTTLISAAVPADLVVTSVQMPDSVFTLFGNAVHYVVANNGAGTTTGTWTDSLFISCSPVFSPATSFFAAARKHTRTVASGATYSDTFNLIIPGGMAYEIAACFTQQMYSTAYFFVKTNADTSLYEAGSIGNNITGSGSKVLVNPLVDHIVTKVSAADTATVGRPYAISWTNKNTGYRPITADYPHKYYYSYWDAVYFSIDSVLDVNDTKAGEYLKYNILYRNDTLNDAKTPLVPNIVTGDYYVILKTNDRNSITGEKIISNNTNLVRNEDGSAKKIHIIKPLLPDLTDSIISMPPSVAAGQPMWVKYRITNSGEGVTYPTTWGNTLRLSIDFAATPGDGDRILATQTRKEALAPGEWFEDSAFVNIPVTTAPGNYALIAVADSYGTMVEENEQNNLGIGLLTVYEAPQVDLVAESIVHPDTVYLGYNIDTVKWSVANHSPNKAIGYSTDGIYLSPAPVWDSSAVLLGVLRRYMNLDPLNADTLAMTPMVNAVIEGNYYVIAASDIQYNMNDSTRTNNHIISENTIHVKVKELPLHTDENNTLQHVARYYKLLIPDSLIGSTIRVSLKSGDSLTMNNEMYIGGGFVPSASQYDYRFEIPNYGNQQIIITDVTQPVYYIAIRCVSPNPALQDITVRADVLPFAILDVHSSSGANIGNVTVKISGSLFAPGMTAKLTRGSTVIQASAVYYTNSTTVYATFPLTGAALGLYNIALTKPDETAAVLPDGFSVVPANNGGLITGSGPNTIPGDGNEPGCYPGTPSGLNSQLVVDLVVPTRVLTNRPVVIQVHYSNPTNFDVPAQTRILFSDYDVKLALTKEGVPSGTTELYLELIEPGGPPGILRAGGSGTITVYCNAPASVPNPTGYVTFKLR